MLLFGPSVVALFHVLSLFLADPGAAEATLKTTTGGGLRTLPRERDDPQTGFRQLYMVRVPKMSPNVLYLALFVVLKLYFLNFKSSICHPLSVTCLTLLTGRRR